MTSGLSSIAFDERKIDAIFADLDQCQDAPVFISHSAGKKH